MKDFQTAGYVALYVALYGSQNQESLYVADPDIQAQNVDAPWLYVTRRYFFQVVNSIPTVVWPSSRLSPRCFPAFDPRCFPIFFFPNLFPDFFYGLFYLDLFPGFIPRFVPVFFQVFFFSLTFSGFFPPHPTA